MPGFQIHLAVAKRYLEKNPSSISNPLDFYHGVISPDLVSNKDISHYTYQGKRSTDLVQYLNEKVELYRFLEKEKVDTDFQKGVFLHLITDYIFFNYFFSKEYLSTVPYEKFAKRLYFAYDLTNSYIEEHYQLDFFDFKETIMKAVYQSKKDRNLLHETPTEGIFTISEIDQFIEEVSSTSLEEYIGVILKAKKNVLPLHIELVKK